MRSLPCSRRKPETPPAAPSAKSWRATIAGLCTASPSLLGVIAGDDPRDPTSGHVPVPDNLAEIASGVTGRRIGIADAYLRRHVDPAVQALVDQAIATLEGLGATFEEVTLPHLHLPPCRLSWPF